MTTTDKKMLNDLLWVRRFSANNDGIVAKYDEGMGQVYLTQETNQYNEGDVRFLDGRLFYVGRVHAADRLFGKKQINMYEVKQ